MDDNIKSLMQETYELCMDIDSTNNRITELKTFVSNLENQLIEKKALLLSYLKEQSIEKLEDNNVVVAKFSRKNVGYTSEDDVMKLLKDKFNSLYIKTKISESLDKTQLKKALKTDTNLANELSAFINNSATEYVVVTSNENYTKMLEHMNE